MRYPAEETARKHQRLLEAASVMVRQKGLDGVSVSEVMKAAGMTHGAFYSHFANKEQMAETALATALVQTDAGVEQVLAARPDPKDSFLHYYLSPAHRDDPGSGCAMAALAAEIGRAGVGRQVMAGHLRGWLDRIAGGFKWAKGSAQRDQAILMTAAMVGAVILARAVDNPELSNEILDATRTQLLERG
jgi:TetR/AcrR family transcriptional regulator, transcriptional repressor for nem operon